MNIRLPPKAIWENYMTSHYPRMERLRMRAIARETELVQTRLVRQETKQLDYDSYLESDHWNERRRRSIELADFRCKRCGASAPEVILHVHHKTYKRLGNEHDSDLEVLCERCHREHHERAT